MTAKFSFGCILADSKNTFGKLLQKYYNTVAAVILHILNIANDTVTLFMAALHSRCGHYIFALWFLSIFFLSSPNLSGCRLDVYHTSTHGVALVRI